MPKRILLIIILLCNVLYSQENKKIQSNIEIFDLIVGKGLNELGNRLALLGNDKIYTLNIPAEKGLDMYLKSIIEKKFQGYRIIFKDTTLKSDYIINIIPVILKTMYPDIKTEYGFGNKTIKRNLSINFSVSFYKSEQREKIYSYEFFDKYTDNVDYEMLEFVENSGYDFTKGKLPDENIFRKMLIPAVVVSASAIAIILFFVVRSK